MTLTKSGAGHTATPESVIPPLDDEAIVPRANRYFSMSLAVGLLAILALIAALYLARAFFVPLLIGILASYALHPVVDWLKIHHIPRAAGAALVLAALVGSLSWITYSVIDEATAMIEKLPEAARKLRQNLNGSRTSAATPLQNMQETASQLEGAAADAGAKQGARATATPTAKPTAWLHDYGLAQSRLLITIAAQAPIILLLTYFLLASGEHFRRKLIQLVGRPLSRKKDAVRILDEIDAQVQRYLFVTLVSNVLVAFGTWFAFLGLGVEQAGVWGIAAGVLHFIPYLGPAAIALASGTAGFLQYGSPLSGLVIAGASLLVAGGVGFIFTTWLQSRFARVNAAVLFIALLFFAWLWGVWGLLLGAPLLAIIKVVCDRVDALKPVGDLLGR